MKDSARTTLIITTLIFAAVAAILALPLQAEENEESLVIWLAERVDELFGRVERLEAIYDGPGPAYLRDGHCILAVSGPGGPELALQHQTILNYMAQFDSLPPEYSLFSVQGDPETGETLIFYKTHDEEPLFVIERWYACEFRGSSDWLAAKG